MPLKNCDMLKNTGGEQEMKTMILETARLLLRPMTVADADAVIYDNECYALKKESR